MSNEHGNRPGYFYELNSFVQRMDDRVAAIDRLLAQHIEQSNRRLERLEEGSGQFLVLTNQITNLGTRIEAIARDLDRTDSGAASGIRSSWTFALMVLGILLPTIIAVASIAYTFGRNGIHP